MELCFTLSDDIVTTPPSGDVLNQLKVRCDKWRKKETLYRYSAITLLCIPIVILSPLVDWTTLLFLLAGIAALYAAFMSYLPTFLDKTQPVSLLLENEEMLSVYNLALFDPINVKKEIRALTEQAKQYAENVTILGRPFIGLDANIIYHLNTRKRAVQSHD